MGAKRGRKTRGRGRSSGRAGREEEEGKGTCHQPGSPGTTGTQAWPRLLHDVVIKTVHVFLLHPAATSARCGPGCQREQLSPDVPSCKMRAQRCWERHRSLGGMAKGTGLSGGNHITVVTCPGPSSSHKREARSWPGILCQVMAIM